MFPESATQIRAMPVPSADPSSLAAACLSAAERGLMTKYRHRRRRSEFVAGRLALKRALLETQDSAIRISAAAPLPDTLLPAAQRMQVLPDDEGRPRLWLEDAVVPMQLSIAHAAGWAAAACSRLPVGVDIVDIDAPTAIPDTPWLANVDGGWRVRLRALLWGLRECLLKSGQISAKTVWSLNGVDAVPTCPAGEIVARWPRLLELASFEMRIEQKRVDAAFVSLSRSAILTMILLPAPRHTSRMHIQ